MMRPSVNGGLAPACKGGSRGAATEVRRTRLNLKKPTLLPDGSGRTGKWGIEIRQDTTGKKARTAE